MGLPKHLPARRPVGKVLLHRSLRRSCRELGTWRASFPRPPARAGPQPPAHCASAAPFKDHPVPCSARSPQSTFRLLPVHLRRPPPCSRSPGGCSLHQRRAQRRGMFCPKLGVLNLLLFLQNHTLEPPTEASPGKAAHSGRFWGSCGETPPAEVPLGPGRPLQKQAGGVVSSPGGSEREAGHGFPAAKAWARLARGLSQRTPMALATPVTGGS